MPPEPEPKGASVKDESQRWRFMCYVNTAVTSALVFVMLFAFLVVALTSSVFTRAFGATGPARMCIYGTYYSASNGGACLPCPHECADCTFDPLANTIACTRCTEGHQTTGGACTRCPAGTHGDGGAAPCMACPQTTWSPGGSIACAACSGTCHTCNPVSGACVSCPAGTGMEGGGVCALCGVGTYSAEGAADACAACGAACATCDPSTGLCTSCVRGRAGPRCDVCEGGTWSPGTLSVCEPCPSECLECDPATAACTACGSDAVLYETTCVRPSDLAHLSRGCREFAADNLRCEACYAGFGFVPATYRCYLCGTNYTSNGGRSQCTYDCPEGTYDYTGLGLCVPCEEGCMQCNKNTGGCLACEAGYAWSYDDWACTPCADGYTSDGYRSTECYCPAGSYSPDGELCIPCAQPCVLTAANGTIVDDNVPCHPEYGTCDGRPSVVIA